MSEKPPFACFSHFEEHLCNAIRVPLTPSPYDHEMESATFSDRFSPDTIEKAAQMFRAADIAYV